MNLYNILNIHKNFSAHFRYVLHIDERKHKGREGNLSPDDVIIHFFQRSQTEFVVHRANM